MRLDGVDGVAIHGHEPRDSPLWRSITPQLRARLAIEECDRVFLFNGYANILHRREIGNLWRRMLPTRRASGGIERIQDMRSFDVEVGNMLML